MTKFGVRPLIKNFARQALKLWCAIPLTGAVLSACEACSIENEPQRLDPTPDGAECDDSLSIASASDATSECLSVPTDIQAEVLWTWSENPIAAGRTHVMSSPLAIPLEDSDGDGVVDADDASDVVFLAFDDASDASVVALRGSNGEILWSTGAPDAPAPSYHGGLAAGVLTPGESPSVLYQTSQGEIVCLDASGAVRWSAGGEADGGYYADSQAVPLLADLDGDGRAEILFGQVVLASDGTLLGTVDDATYEGDGETFGMDAFDLDADGLPEVIRANVYYDGDLVPLWTSDRRDGNGVAAAEFVADGAPMVVANAYPGGADGADLGIHLRGADGTLAWSGTALPGGGGGSTAVGQLDTDQSLEFVMAGGVGISAFDDDGALLWTSPIHDESSGQAAAALYDFNRDGVDDVAFGDEEDFYVLDGTTGTEWFRDDLHANDTLREGPIIADLDGDGSAEIVVANAAINHAGEDGIVVYRASLRDWPTSNRTWAWSGWREGGLGADLTVVPSTRAPRRVARSADCGDLVPVETVWCDGDCAEGAGFVTVYLANVSTEQVPAGARVEVLDSDGAALSEPLIVSEAIEGGTTLGPFTVPVAWTGADPASARVVVSVPCDCNPSNNRVGGRRVDGGHELWHVVGERRPTCTIRLVRRERACEDPGPRKPSLPLVAELQLDVPAVRREIANDTRAEHRLVEHGGPVPVRAARHRSCDRSKKPLSDTLELRAVSLEQRVDEVMANLVHEDRHIRKPRRPVRSDARAQHRNRGAHPVDHHVRPIVVLAARERADHTHTSRQRLTEEPLVPIEVEALRVTNQCRVDAGDQRRLLAEQVGEHDLTGGLDRR